MKKLLFVFNPFSGKAQIKNHLLEIVDTMVKAEYEVTIYPTQHAGDAREKVKREAEKYDFAEDRADIGYHMLDKKYSYPRKPRKKAQVLWRIIAGLIALTIVVLLSMWARIRFGWHLDIALGSVNL